MPAESIVPRSHGASRIAKAVNAYLGGGNAKATDPSNVELTVPANYPGGVMALLTDIEQVKVDPDQPAKVIIDENSGVIVMGADVRIAAPRALWPSEEIQAIAHARAEQSGARRTAVTAKRHEGIA